MAISSIPPCNALAVAASSVKCSDWIFFMASIGMGREPVPRVQGIDAEAPSQTWNFQEGRRPPTTLRAPAPGPVLKKYHDAFLQTNRTNSTAAFCCTPEPTRGAVRKSSCSPYASPLSPRPAVKLRNGSVGIRPAWDDAGGGPTSACRLGYYSAIVDSPCPARIARDVTRGRRARVFSRRQRCTT